MLCRKYWRFIAENCADLLAEDFSEYLITEKMISTVPWDDAGSYVRFSVTFEEKDEEDERRIISAVKRRLFDINFVF